jgi:hypothetical protein
LDGRHPEAGDTMVNGKPRVCITIHRRTRGAERSIPNALAIIVSALDRVDRAGEHT